MASKTDKVLFGLVMLLLSSCSVFRGLTLDGPSGPDIYMNIRSWNETLFSKETIRFIFHLLHRIVA